MLVELKVSVDRRALSLGDRTLDQAIEEANGELAREASKHFGAGRITIGRLPDGRWYFRHIALGTMIRIPDCYLAAAQKALLHSILPAVRILPAEGAESIPEVHGVWARQKWVEDFIGSNFPANLASAHVA